MLQSIYKIFIEPRSTDPDQRNRELVLNWLLAGLASLLAIYSLNYVVRLILFEQNVSLFKLLIISTVLAIVLLYCIVLRGRKNIRGSASTAVVLSLFMGGTVVLMSWGIINPYGTLLFALVVVMSGILFRAKHSLYALLAIVVTLTALEYARDQSILIPDTSWISSPSSLADVINLGAIFLVMALASWLFNKRMEESLYRAKQSEKALQKERDLLEMKVEERTRALQEAQLEKVQQFYKFAELGHLSTALFHDLAGSLSSLSLDIESLRAKSKTDFTKRIDSNIRYIDSVVQRVKSQIQGKDDIETFDIVAEIKDLVGILSYNARKARTCIKLETAGQSMPFTGNLTRFRQLIINLLSNAIESYPPAPQASAADRPVVIKLAENLDAIIIQVSDHGKGIQKSKRDKIFDPFYTTKSSGSGIGLFIVSQVAENDFNGTIKLRSSKKSGTTFTITLPKNTGHAPKIS